MDTLVLDFWPPEPERIYLLVKPCRPWCLVTEAPAKLSVLACRALCPHHRSYVSRSHPEASHPDGLPQRAFQP